MVTKQFENPVTVIKFGFCGTADANNRFTQDYLNKKNYWGIALSEDYEVDTLWSGYFTRSEITLLEKLYKVLLPENITGMNKYNGYTEYRGATLEEALIIKERFKKEFPKENHKFQSDLFKAYFIIACKKGTPEGESVRINREHKDLRYAKTKTAKLKFLNFKVK